MLASNVKFMGIENLIGGGLNGREGDKCDRDFANRGGSSQHKWLARNSVDETASATFHKSVPDQNRVSFYAGSNEQH